MRTSTPDAQPFDRQLEDVGNIVEFGHINVRVPDQQRALVFYVTGLGLTRDPFMQTGSSNAWINVGTCQIHLPVGPVEILRGMTGLVMPDLDALAARLRKVAPELSGTAFAFHPRDQYIDVTCPWGNRIRVHAPSPARFGAMELGMPYVQIDVAPGSVDGIARFYAQVLANTAQLGSDAAGVFVRIPCGPAQSLVFRETAAPLPAYDGHHIQITVADFSGVHRRLLEYGLITEESSQSQYRFANIIDPTRGGVLATIEHEVRSMRHPLYARFLVNLPPMHPGT